MTKILQFSTIPPNPFSASLQTSFTLFLLDLQPPFSLFFALHLLLFVLHSLHSNLHVLLPLVFVIFFFRYPLYLPFSLSLNPCSPSLLSLSFSLQHLCSLLSLSLFKLPSPIFHVCLLMFFLSPLPFSPPIRL